MSFYALIRETQVFLDSAFYYYNNQKLKQQ
jgi:hypothetical protein